MAFHRKQRRRSKQIARCTMKLPILRPSHISNRHPFSCYIFRYTDSSYVISGWTNELRELDWALSRVICPEARTARVTYYLSQDDSDIYGTSSVGSVHVSAERGIPQRITSTYRMIGLAPPAPLHLWSRRHSRGFQHPPSADCRSADVKPFFFSEIPWSHPEIFFFIRGNVRSSDGSETVRVAGRRGCVTGAGRMRREDAFDE